MNEAGMSKSLMQERPKVLIVDDEPFNHRVLKLKFENAGYQVILAENGKEGLEKFALENPDILITDIKMPVMDGQELCKHLPETEDYLLIVVTSLLEQEARNWVSKIPDVIFVEKPVSPRYLVERANRYLTEHPNRRNRSSSPHRGGEATGGKEVHAELNQDNLAKELASRYEELNLIYKIGQRFRINEKVEGVLSDLLEETAICLNADIATISLRSQNVSFDKNTSSTIEVFLSESDLFLLKKAVGEKLRTDKKPFMLPDLRTLPSLKNLPSMKLLVSPIVLGSEPGGYIALLRHSQKNDFSTGDINLLTLLSSHASVVTTNYALYQELKHILFSVVTSLSDAIAARDSDSRGHNQRISEISLAIGKSMNLPEQELEHLKWASVLHDIGMIGIPESVLRKQARLTDEEFAILKTHPEKGYQILKHIEPLQEALAGVLHHHERFDGTGYPRGLKGTEIPLCARILAVSDAYVCTASGRADQEARSQESSMEEILRFAGTQLDPEVVAVFKKLTEENPKR